MITTDVVEGFFVAAAVFVGMIALGLILMWRGRK